MMRALRLGELRNTLKMAFMDLKPISLCCISQDEVMCQERQPMVRLRERWGRWLPSRGNWRRLHRGGSTQSSIEIWIKFGPSERHGEDITGRENKSMKNVNWNESRRSWHCTMYNVSVYNGNFLLEPWKKPVRVLEQSNDMGRLIPPKPIKFVGGKRVWRWFIHLFNIY